MRGEELGVGQGHVQDTWRPNTTQLRVHLGVQEQCALDCKHRPYMESDFNIPHMVGKICSRASNGTEPTTKLCLSQRESSNQVDVQNLSRCCVTIFWAVGLCIVLEPIRGASKGLARPFVRPQLHELIIHLQFCLHSSLFLLVFFDS
jgi:hypothetical protein